MVSGIKRQDNGIQTECKRCGCCCMGGGPCLHLEDRHLVTSGTLKPSDLVTFRSGDLAFNPVKGELVPIPGDMIKIRGRNLVGECIFFDQPSSSCRIYGSRPLECRVLKCWDTREIEALFLERLLSRRDLIPKGSLLLALVEKYDAHFPVEMVLGLCRAGSKDRQAIINRLEMLRDRDRAFRLKVCQMLAVSMEACDFFFGRPVSSLLEAFNTLQESACEGK